MSFPSIMLSIQIWLIWLASCLEYCSSLLHHCIPLPTTELTRVLAHHKTTTLKQFAPFPTNNMSTKRSPYTVMEVKPSLVGSSESNKDQELKGDGSEGQWEKGAKSSHQDQSRPDSLWVIQINEDHTHIQFCDISRKGPAPDSELLDPSIPATDASVFTQLTPPGVDEITLVQRFTEQLSNWLDDR